LDASIAFDALPAALGRLAMLWVPQHAAMLLCGLGLIGIALHALAGADDRRVRQPARRNPERLV
jgi:hypothetical protein